MTLYDRDLVKRIPPQRGARNSLDPKVSQQFCYIFCTSPLILEIRGRIPSKYFRRFAGEWQFTHHHYQFACL